MDDADELWVQIEAIKNTGTVIYRGKVLREDLNAWKRGELDKGALTLRRTYWFDNRTDKLELVVVGRDGIFKQATGIAHIAARTVLTVMELRAPDPGVEAQAEVLQLAPMGGGTRGVLGSDSEP